MTTPEEYLDWLKAIEREAIMSSEAHRRIAENNQRQAEEVIGNMAAIDSITTGGKVVEALAGSPLP